MRLQAQFTEDKEVLKELQLALKQGDETKLDRYGDIRFIEAFKEQDRRVDAMLKALYFGLLGFLPLLLHAFTFNYTWLLIFAMLQVPWVILFLRIQKPKDWERMRHRLAEFPLPLLVENCNYNLIAQILAKRLLKTTDDELISLSASQRHNLVLFTVAMAKPITGERKLRAERAQSATAGFLALATLKQPGAELLLPASVLAQHPNLRCAIEEYQSAMKVPG